MPLCAREGEDVDDANGVALLARPWAVDGVQVARAQWG